jgi:hypothetical protein
MKKILVLLFISVLVLQANGQVEKPITKGHFIVGGTFNFVTDKYDYIDPDGQVSIVREHSIFEGGAYLGYFIFNHFFAGLEIDYMIKRTDYGHSINTRDEVIIGPSIRYYLNVGIFSTASVGFGYDYSGPKNSLTKYRAFQWEVGLGYSLFLNKNIALESIVNYSMLRQTGVRVDDFVKEYKGFNVTIGIQFYFNGRRKDKVNN